LVAGHNTFGESNCSVLSTSYKENIGIALNIMIVTAGASPFVLALVFIYSQLDPFYYIFEFYILPNSYYRSLLTVIVALITRYILTLLCVVEYFRIGLYSILVMFSVGLATMSFIRQLSCMDETSGWKYYSDKSFPFYLSLRVAFTVAWEKLGTVTFFLVLLGHIGTVVALWVVFKCWKIIPILSLIAIGRAAVFRCSFSVS